MEEGRNYLRLLSRWREMEKDDNSLKLLNGDEKRKHLEEVEKYEKEVLNSEIYGEDKKVLLGLVKNYKEKLVGNSLDPLEILFFLSFFNFTATIVNSIERYKEKVGL